MTVRLLLGVAFVANILVLVLCTESTHATATSVSSANATSSSSYSSSSSSAKTVVKSKPVKCRKAKKCPKNEEFSYCPESIQRAQYCSEKAEPSTYRSTAGKPCKEACVCKENYLRAENGTCLPADQCPITCGANEVLDNCPSDCQSDYCPTEEDSEAKTCVTPDVCPPPVCKCAFNHRRDCNGSCIPTKDCPPFKCRTNEEYNGCPPFCPTDDCSQASPSGECPPQFGRIGIVLPCNPKCRCIKDYWRLDGICVPYGQCPGVCPDNERYSTCVQAECRALNCTQKDQSVPCIRIDPTFCEKGCVCEEGYLRNKDGICVLEDKCEPGVCPDNERYSTCVQAECRALNCTQKDQSVPCIRIDPTFCEKGCVCEEGYLRNKDGICVLKDKCEPGVCPDNERYSTCVQAECRALNCTQKDQSVPCIRIDPTFCEKGCVCEEGYLRNKDGICVLEDKCEPGVCPDNERYSTCVQAECRALNCTQKDQSVPCIRIDPTFCKKGCVCEEGYLRNKDGICVLEDKCEPGVCPDNERYSTCVQAECRALNCTQKDQSVPCIRIDPTFCKKGCVCEEGYLRNKDGICVLEDKCEPGVCPDNERYSTCVQAECRALNCTQKDQSVPCIRIDPTFCEKGCVCEEGYLRNKDGICVLEDKCEPGVCPDNERYSTCVQAECRALNCTQKDQSVPCIRIDPTFCEKGCVCEEGYLRNKDGICVLEDKCEPGVCPDNERYSTCVQAECRALNCTQKDQSVPCIRIDPTFCEKGCVCEEGYLRNKDDICVLEDKCEPGVCPDNERYSTCVQAECRALNCTQKDQSVPCIRIDPTFCEKGCVCEEGYLRNKDGICVLEDKCEPTPSCTSANEEFVPCMQGVCRAKDCSQKGKDVPCPDIPAEECDSGCICKEHFLRSANGTCIPEDQCETNKCPPFEEWNECSNADCSAEFCYQKGLPVACPSVTECAPGCLCQYGYLREESGVCVPEEDCKPNPCPLNEVLSNCTQAVCRTQNCTDSGKPVVCPAVAEGDCEKGCVCKEGYLRVEDGLYCVPDDQCNANKCPLFEVWDHCANAACRAENCTQKGLPVPCPSVTECVPGCLCRPGYLRHANGFCVPEEECNTHICPLYEEWSTCAQATCRAQKCSEKGETISCPLIAEGYCEEACVCQENYLRNENGDCVPEDECPPKTCGENEVLDNCSLTCNSDNCPQSADEEQVCTQSNPCVPACKCEFNYKRAENGTCIPTRDCPPFNCSAKPNEVYVPCPLFCPTDECGKPRLEGRCPFIIGTFLQCNPKCQCMDGYGRVNGTCVPFEECPDLCPANEVYSPCVQQTCRPQNCSDRDVATETCPTSDAASCQRGCVCQENYYRNDTGVCVSYEECAPKTCSENEVLDDCPMKCNSDNCPKSADEKQVCTQSDPCVPACKCRFNYKRAENGSCIPTRNCPPFDCSAKPNEKFVPCPPICPTDECGKPRLEGRCPFRIGIILQCKPKCQCMDGYGRSNGTCVPFEECPGLCPANEVYSSCVQQTCRPQNCSDRDLAMDTCPTSDTASCQRGCVCQENYYRNDKGVCISYEECGGPMCPNAHEEYTPNFKECPPNTCQSLVVRRLCDENQKEGPGCICESGYLRINVTSHCIPICDCPEMKGSPDC